VGYSTTAIVTFLEPSVFALMTLLVALAVPTAVKLRPLLASRVTSGTVLVRTTTLRGSMESDAFPEPLAGDGDCPSAVSERASITAMNTAANFVRAAMRMNIITARLGWRVHLRSGQGISQSAGGP